MHSQNKNSSSYLAERNAEMNFRRREKYKQMASTEKQALLLKRRLRAKKSTASVVSSERAIMHRATTLAGHYDRATNSAHPSSIFEVGNC
nr:uncharacterized protein LOC117278781 isoform X2 [Nicotiana tomentosiformis]